MLNRKFKFVVMMFVGLAVMGFAGSAFAQDAVVSVEAAKASANAWIAMAAAIAIAIAALGGALGQSRAAAAALEGIARNPGAADKLFTPMILGLALIESLVIYALIIAFLLQGKLG